MSPTERIGRTAGFFSVNIKSLWCWLSLDRSAFIIPSPSNLRLRPDPVEIPQSSRQGQVPYKVVWRPRPISRTTTRTICDFTKSAHLLVAHVCLCPEWNSLCHRPQQLWFLCQRDSGCKPDVVASVGWVCQLQRLPCECLLALLLFPKAFQWLVVVVWDGVRVEWLFGLFGVWDNIAYLNTVSRWAEK